MYIISALHLRGLFSSRTPMEHHEYHMETTGLEDSNPRYCYKNLRCYTKVTVPLQVMKALGVEDVWLLLILDFGTR
jgi:hypothetical protein